MPLAQIPIIRQNPALQPCGTQSAARVPNNRNNLQQEVAIRLGGKVLADGIEVDPAAQQFSKIISFRSTNAKSHQSSTSLRSMRNLPSFSCHAG
jgi:hypothetical protein